MAPEQLLFFALFLLLALFNLVARWIRGRMRQRPADVDAEEGPPRPRPRGGPPVQEVPPPRRAPPVREVPSPRGGPPVREVPSPREAPPVREAPPLREMPPVRATSGPATLPAPWEHPLPPHARERTPVGPDATGTPIAARSPAPAAERIRRPVSRVRLGDRAELRRAIVLREILGPPLGLQRPERET